MQAAALVKTNHVVGIYVARDCHKAGQSGGWCLKIRRLGDTNMFAPLENEGRMPRPLSPVFSGYAGSIGIKAMASPNDMKEATIFQFISFERLVISML